MEFDKFVIAAGPAEVLECHARLGHPHRVVLV